MKKYFSDLTDDDNLVISSPVVVKREPRKYTVIELIDLVSKDSDSDEDTKEPRFKKQHKKKQD